jgi:accessory gene regulator B
LIKIITKFSGYLANAIRKNNPDASSFVVLRYALNVIINSIIIISIVLIAGLITGKFLESILAVLAFPVLRYFSGGMHLKSSTVCNIISTLIIMICVYTPVTYWYNGIVLNVISLILIAIFAPSGIKQSKMKKENYKYLKMAALLIVASNFAIQSPVLSLAFFAQSITTIPVFEKWLDRLNW